MKLVIFGLTLSSSWGNGHATLWRGLIRALARNGHEVVFFERDVPYYAAHRDLNELPGAQLILYDGWHSVLERARQQVCDADVLLVTSYCPDAITAARLIFDQASSALRVFYDLDTPVTLARLEAGERVDYLPEGGLSGFDLVLSYTGGEALRILQHRLGARRVAPLYGHVDPDRHRPIDVERGSRAALSYLGTYARDRQEAVEKLFIGPARARPAQRFVLGGAGYPHDFPWQPNIWFVRHVAPAGHSAFFCGSRLTLNVTRADMAAMGFCPSGRLFEAAACGVAIMTDNWVGLDEFFEPGEEILTASSTQEAVDALDLSSGALARIARAARERVLARHTSQARAVQLIDTLESLR
jgi:spore maturation protein CgeB